MSLKGLLRKGIAISIIATLAIGVIGCGESKKEENATGTLAKDTIVVGFDDTFVPMGFKGDDGEYEGFDIEMAKAVFEKMGKKVEFQPIEWKMKETELNSNKIDVIWNGYSISDERKEKVEFSKPYLNNRQIIVTLAGSTIKTKEDLKGKTVGAQTESTAVDAIGDYESNFKELVTFDTNELALRDLEAGRIDAVVADEILIKYYIKQKGEDKFAIATDDFGAEEYAVGIRKGDTEFVEALNKAYDEVVADGKASEISEKWFGEDIIVK